MSEGRNDIGPSVWTAIRKELDTLRRASKERMGEQAHSPEAVGVKARRRRDAFAAFMRKGDLEERPTEVELDHLLRFEDRFTALLQRKRH